MCLRGRQSLDTEKLALDFIGICGNRVEPHHLNRARCLVDMGSGVLERGGIARRSLVRGERIQSAGKGVVDLTLNPGQRAEIEIGCGVGGQGLRAVWTARERATGSVHAKIAPIGVQGAVG